MRYSCSSLNPYFFPGASVAVLLPPVMNVTDGPAVGVVVALHPVVMVSVMVGMTHPVAHVGQAVVVYFVGVTGQQFVAHGTAVVVTLTIMGHTSGSSPMHLIIGQTLGVVVAVKV